MNTKKHFLISFIVIAILAGLAYYFLYYTKTPTYALNAAHTSYQEHNLQKFERYVDINSVMDSAFNDIIKAESQINNDNIFSNPFALGILHMLKPSVVDLMIQETRTKIVNEKNFLDKEKQIVDPVPDAMKKNMERRIPLAQIEIVNFKISKVENDYAVANIVLHLKDLKQNFIADVLLEKNTKNDWQIKKINNLSELVVQIDAAKKTNLALSNKPIIERINKAVQTLDAQAEIISKQESQELKKFLKTTIKIKNMDNTSIRRMYYDILIFDEHNKQIYSYPEHFQGNLAPADDFTLKSIKKLSTLLPDDKKLIEQNMSKNKCQIQVTYIVFEDGTVLSPNTLIE